MILLGVTWLVANAVRKAGSRPSGGDRTPGAPRPPTRQPNRPPITRLPARLPADATKVKVTAPLDPTQREGARLEQLLRQLGRTLEDAAGPVGRRPDRPLPAAEDQEETESLEVTPVVRSLETEGDRGARAEVDQDDEAESIVARRLRAAESHLTPRSRADHRAFDAKIRQQPADKTAVAPTAARRLRNAVVWREILGPPVSLRDFDER